VVVEPRPYRTWVEISRGQIAANYQAIRRTLSSDTQILPVVKADAYRHGAVEISRALEAEGAQWLAVSSTEEGIALREAGIRARILVMADVLPFTREALLSHNLTPVIHSLADVQALKSGPYHLKLDTGMSRLGVREEASDIIPAIRSNPYAELEGLMTHFASAANYESSQTEDQTRRFESIIDALAQAGIRPRYIHCSSSIPVAYGRKSPACPPGSTILVRPGHAIYGYVSPARGPAPHRTLQVKPALTWRASILALKDLPAAALVGYGGMYRTTKPTRIAVLAAGYADGIPHRLSGRGQVIVRGQLAPILGAVSMDLTTVDVTNIPGLSVGDAVTLLGTEGNARIDAQQIARWAGTISYSVLCGIHARVKRIYI
jgi:alanine racemase